MQKSKIYVVSAFGGQYDDSWETPVAAFESIEDAKVFKARKEAEVPVYSEHLDKLESRIYDFCQIWAYKIFKEANSDQYWDTADEMEAAMKDKLAVKYEGFTGSYYKEEVYYKITELDFYKGCGW